MTMFKWSQTAADNDDADLSINLRENQSPSTYNNAVRAVMAAVAKYRDDMSGNLVTGGTSTAITITSNQVFAAMTDGIYLRARITTTSGATPTLAVDGLTAKAIQTVSGTAIPTGALQAGAIHTFTYDSSADAWIVSDRFGDTMRTGTNLDLVAIEALAGTTGALKKTAANTWSLDDFTTAIIFEKDNNGTVLPSGIWGDTRVPFACTITGLTLLADQTGSVDLDIQRDTYANYPPTTGDFLVGIDLVSQVKNEITGLSIALNAGDVLRFHNFGVTSVTRITLVITVKRF